ncbi:MAG: hypothetical protein LBM25_03440 [Bacteroidales bacterium]|jgi:hypothetical protein|nr:hypothetical protein [Bacteroidales bacterium]
MKKVLIAILMLGSSVIFVNAQDVEVAYPKDQSLVNKLENYYELSLKPNNLFDRKNFFEVFPNDFKTFNSIYGCHENRIKGRYTTFLGPLYKNFYDHIRLFFSLDSVIDKDTFYMKVINIAIDGYWESSVISVFQSCIKERIPNDIYFILKTVNKLSDEKACSFWLFLFDGPYPYSKKSMYEKLYRLVVSKDSKQATLMKQAYNKLLDEERLMKGVDSR